jgi:hypothetical protein
MFRFVTKWFFQAPIGEVWEQITDVEAYPEKWPIWKRTVFCDSKSELQLGSVVDCVARGIVPYTVRFTFAITAFQPPTLMAFESSGDLVGTGRWVLEPQDSGTVVTSTWNAGSPIALINVVSKMPFGKGILAKHHDYVMGQGYRGFRARLEA